MKKYIDYFDIDPSYYPEINPDSIKDQKWYRTTPHKTFIDVLKQVERTLSRETTEACKGIWIEGSYGTGKSRVIWTIDNILTCSNEELSKYFNSYALLQQEKDLLNKINALKSGKILTVYKYKSGDIDNINKLIIKIYESVTKALKNNKFDYIGKDTIRGKIVSFLEEDEENRNIFAQLINKPKYKSLGSLNGKSVSEIIKILKNTNQNAEDLVNDIIKISDDNINLFSLDMDDLKSWISEVLSENKDKGLKAIVLLWDEFSAFFKKNKDSLDVFQSLAELSNNDPFYLIIATHESSSIVSPEEKASFKVISDRFNHFNIKMPNSTAFELIADAMDIKKTSKSEYEILTSELNDNMKKSREAVCRLNDKDIISEETMKRLCPIHPMTALLLKHISTFFASNQRSMFNFIKDNDSDKLKAFQWFINNYSPEDGQLLAVDFLWDFFYNYGTTDHSSFSGRANLDIIIANILDTYPREEKKLNNEQKRVLKAVLMMLAINKRLNNSVELLIPNDKNIKMVFEGDDNLEDKAVNIVKNFFVDNFKILYIDKDENNQDVYKVNMPGEEQEILKIKERLLQEVKTINILESGENSILSSISFPNKINIRYKFYYLTVDNFTKKLNKIAEEETKLFKAVLCFARNKNEQLIINNKIKEAIKDDIFKDIVFVDMSNNLLSDDKFNNFIDYSAREEYWRGKDDSLADEKKRNKEMILDDWANDINNGEYKVSNVKNAYAKDCNSFDSLKEALVEIVLKYYPLVFDNYKIAEPLFNSSDFNIGILCGLGISNKKGDKYYSVYQEKDIRMILGKLVDDDNYWITDKSHNISQIKIKLDEYIQNEFDRNNKVSIGDIFDFLMGLGFIYNNLYAYLTGFLLKGYSCRPYRYSIGLEGENGGEIDPNKLAEFVSEYMKFKQTGKNEPKIKYIQIMTDNQREFLSFINSSYGVDKDLSVEQAVIHLRNKLLSIGYPLWVYKTIDENGLSDYIDKLSNIVNTDRSQNVADLVEQFGKQLVNNTNLAINLKALLTLEKGKEAMDTFLDTFEAGSIKTLAKEIRVIDYIKEVQETISKGIKAWLWNEEDGKKELRKLILDYKIIAKSNNIIDRTNCFSDCIAKWKEFFEHNIKLPYSIVMVEYNELSDFFDCIKESISSAMNIISYESRQKFFDAISNNENTIININERCKELLKNKFITFVTDFSDDDIENLYISLSNDSFIKSESEFYQIIKREANLIQNRLLRNKIVSKWKELTNTASSKEWCNKYRCPILIMIDDAEFNDAKDLFTVLDESFKFNDSMLQRVLEFIEKKPKFIFKINNKTEIDKVFSNKMIREYQVIIDDVEDLKNKLSSIDSNYYNWYGNQVINDAIREFAQDKYLNGGFEEIKNDIQGKTADEVKSLLLDLISNNVDAGILVIKKR
ncbi:MAG: hypothetical protein IJS60_00965 [Abditibacteriota bacterium]|nr:hypothetical protein [Abditibacteriota bacterium]